MLSASKRTTVVVDVSQKSIIENRRKIREQTLKELDERTTLAEKNIETLTRLIS
jgi:hypothetical protein